MPSAVSSTAAPNHPSPNASHHTRRASLRVLSRNIDKVVLGNLVFRSWYYSPYPDSIILGDCHHHAQLLQPVAAGKAHVVPIEEAIAGTHDRVNGVSKVDGLPPCQTLHVCPYCFRYTPDGGDYAAHIQIHVRAERNASSYLYDDEDDTVDRDHWPVPSTALKVYEADGYAVWDIDGEVEKLYCQNLSLFGKLFLEQKSVFFDTAGFHYFVLTYTPPPSDVSKAAGGREGKALNRSTTTAKRKGHSRATGASDHGGQGAVTTWETCGLRTQVLGFFSKENLSWDSNNLACILVFPPFQHRNLGHLLMAVSYKLSGWEWEDSIIGGPEKPLSSMGRRSYVRFWSERIARYLIGQTADADGKKVFDSSKRKRRATSVLKEEMTVKEIGDRTGMLPEDVVTALNEMGICEVLPPKRKKKKISGGADAGQDASTSTSTTTAAALTMDAEEEARLSNMSISRARVLAWAEAKKVDLISPVKEEGFLGEWALSETDQELEGSSDEPDVSDEG